MAAAGTPPDGSLDHAVRGVLERFADSIPTLIAALLAVAIGWLLARLSRRAARQLASLANRFLSHSLHRRAADSGLSEAFITVVGELAFWLVLIVSVVLAAGILGIGSVGQWLNQIVVHLPSLIVGAAILVVGYFLSLYLREMATTAARDRGLGAAGGLGHLVQVGILAVALIIGLDQAGVDVLILVVIFAVISGGLVAGMVAAFVSGARDYVGNLVGARNARRSLQPGLRIRIDDVEGDVLEVSLTHVAIDTAEGRTLVPASEFETRRWTILTSAAEAAPGDG